MGVHTQKIINKHNYAETGLPINSKKLGQALTNKSTKNTGSNNSDSTESIVKVRSAYNFQPGNGAEINNLAKQTKKFLNAVQYSSQADVSANTKTLEKVNFLRTAITDSSGQTKLEKKLAQAKLTGDITKDAALLQPIAQQLNTDLRSIKKVRQQVEREMADAVTETNDLLAQIAKANEQIKAKSTENIELSNIIVNREKNLKELAEHISYKVVEKPDQTVDLQISTGFNLVSGSNFKKLEITKAPGFLDNTASTNQSDNVSSNFIVYDFSLGQGHGHVNLTDRLAAGSGKIAALLKLQGLPKTESNEPRATGVLENLTARIGNLAQGLTNFSKAKDGILSPEQLKKLWQAPIQNTHTEVYTLAGNMQEHATSLGNYLQSIYNNTEVALHISKAQQKISTIRLEQVDNFMVNDQLQAVNAIQTSYTNSIQSLENCCRLIDSTAAIL